MLYTINYLKKRGNNRLSEFTSISIVIAELKTIKDILSKEGVNSKAVAGEKVESLITRLEQKTGNNE